MSTGRAKPGSRPETDQLFQVLDLSSGYNFYKVTRSRITTVSNVRWLSQTGDSTGDRPAFSDFGSSSGYKNCNPTGSRIKFELLFLECDRIPDHHSYIVDRVNLNIDRVGFCEYFISGESG